MINKFESLKKYGTVFCVIFILSFFLTVPQILNNSLVVGADSLFHFNRIYDDYMQLKTGNFNYFQSNYGFQQSGRIVNALYGPGFTYLLGGLLGIVHSWIKFEIVTSFIIFFISGFSMYFLSRELKATKKNSVLAASLFMGSFYITRWSIYQNFMIWGVMLMPLIVILGLKMIKNNAKDLKVLPLALAVSVLIQIHVLSALMSIGVLVVFFFIGFIQTNQKLQLLLKCFLASLLALVLTFNVWGAMLDVFSNNKIYSPFANSNMSGSTMNLSTGNYSGTQFGLVMSIIFVLQIVWLFSKRKELSLANKIVTIIGAIFLALTTNLFPWTRISILIPQLQSFLQFPYRFDSFTTILLVAGFSATISTLPSPNAKKNCSLFLIVGSIFILGQSYSDIQTKNEIWNSNESIIAKGHVTTPDSLSTVQIRNAFTNRDLKKGLEVAQKSTPDYLPNNQELSKDPYNEYKNEIIMNKSNIIKRVTDKGDLSLRWTATKIGETMSLPIIVYNNSKVTLNGTKLNIKKITLSNIGSPTIKATKKGINRVTLSYHSKIITKPRLMMVIAAWVISSLAFITFTYRDYKNDI